MKDEDTAKKLHAELKAHPEQVRRPREGEVDRHRRAAQRAATSACSARAAWCPSSSASPSRSSPGEMSDVVKTQYGYHIIMVTERKDGERKPFDQVKEQIRATLRNKALQEQDRRPLRQPEEGGQREDRRRRRSRASRRRRPRGRPASGMATRTRADTGTSLRRGAGPRRARRAWRSTPGARAAPSLRPASPARCDSARATPPARPSRASRRRRGSRPPLLISARRQPGAVGAGFDRADDGRRGDAGGVQRGRRARAALAAAGTATRSPPDVCGSQASSARSAGTLRRDVDLVGEPVAVAAAAAGQLAVADEPRARRAAAAGASASKHEPHAAAVRHLVAVPEEAEAASRRCRRGPRSRASARGRGGVQRHHARDRRGLVLAGVAGAALARRRDDPRPERLGEHERVARPRADVAPDAVGMDHARSPPCRT